MKIFIVYDVDGWAFHRRALALQKYCPADAAVRLVKVTDYRGPGDADIVLLLDYVCLGMIQGMTPARVPIVCTFSADARRRDRQWRYTCEHADWIVCLSRERYEQRGDFDNCCCIANGVDFDDFGLTGTLLGRGQRTLWIGRDSPDDNKGLRAVLTPLREMAERAGFDCDFRAVGPQTRFSTARLREWYNGCYVVCASRSEATANTVMEAAACGCVPVSTPVGTLTDWGKDGENCVLVKDRSPEAFLAGLLRARRERLRLAAGAMRAVARYDYRHVAELYWEDVIRPIVEGRKPRQFCYLEREPWNGQEAR